MKTFNICKMLEVIISECHNDENVDSFTIHCLNSAKSDLTKIINEKLAEESVELSFNEIQLIENERPINAIKEYMARTNCSLSIAKCVIDKYRYK